MYWNLKVIQNNFNFRICINAYKLNIIIAKLHMKLYNIDTINFGVIEMNN